MFTELVTAHSDLRSHEGSIPPHLNYFIVEYIFGFFPIKSQQYSNSMISFIITNHQYFPDIYSINGFSKFEILNQPKNKQKSKKRVGAWFQVQFRGIRFTVVEPCRPLTKPGPAMLSHGRPRLAHARARLAGKFGQKN